MTEQDLRQALSQYGTVVSVRILRDPQKQSRGVGFARMNDKEQCQAIINRFHNQSFPGEITAERCEIDARSLPPSTF